MERGGGELLAARSRVRGGLDMRASVVSTRGERVRGDGGSPDQQVRGSSGQHKASIDIPSLLNGDPDEVVCSPTLWPTKVTEAAD
ncbi:hypothetical protein MOX02_48200 [Methylobacterium oxalidis]|uniref:Uncharacterized protein n=1 Tax=Methylobacterium oxalidis TaxID=944322 RepID=A0A512J9Z0_9HYPH|nr:hypothetical protein MOX02_48200 [Methylobacterium oxalidis]GLS67086.1 hypothetical protein GCM10007888_54690 [Methylobacterium oxalidis]